MGLLDRVIDILKHQTYRTYTWQVIPFDEFFFSWCKPFSMAAKEFIQVYIFYLENDIAREKTKQNKNRNLFLLFFYTNNMYI